MQAIFNPPVPLHQSGKTLCPCEQTADVILTLIKGLVLTGSRAFNDNQRGQSTPLGFERWRGMINLNATMHRAAMTLLRVVVATPSVPLLPSAFNRLVQVRLVGLGTHQVVIATQGDLL